MRFVLPAAMVLGLLTGASAGPGAQDSPVDVNMQAKIDQAISRGVEYLKGKKIGNRKGNVLILLTYAHADVPHSDPQFQDLLSEALTTELEHTYQVGLTAMALEEIDRVKHQGRICQCAQFLADNISPQGKTRYGEATTYSEGTPSVSTGGTNPVKSGPRMYDAPGGAVKEKPPVTRILTVKQKRPGPADYDNSNMQYAALGLRACHDAGIRFDSALIASVDQAWRESQNKESSKEEALVIDPPPGGRGKGPGSTKALTTVMAAPNGWGYQKGDPRGSMTVGGIGALCILDYLQGKDWRQDKDVLEGMQWISKNFSVTENPKLGDKWHYYYLYGLERVGMLFGTETIGAHRWYKEGAEFLLAEQDKDGKWKDAVDTCFAILFLKRATRKLIATGDRRK
jgi:hypothetical protein